MNFVQVLMAAQARDNPGSKGSTWGVVLEITIVMFFVALIPKMIVMDPQNMHWYDFWEPVLTAALAALYTYVRARGIELEEAIDV